MSISIILHEAFDGVSAARGGDPVLVNWQHVETVKPIEGRGSSVWFTRGSRQGMLEVTETPEQVDRIVMDKLRSLTPTASA